MNQVASPTNPVDAYAHDVAEGRIPAGKYHRLACVRHLEDRQRERTASFPFYFDWTKAERFLRFASKLRHYKGEWAGKYFTPSACQVFRLGSIFGWRRVDSGLRRFTTAFNEIPRKNGKTFEAAIVAVYVTFFEGEPGAEGYCIATKREQALRVFDDAKKLVRSSGLRSRITVYKGNLHREDTSCKLQPLGADADSTDGLNPQSITTDELHAHKTRALIDVMESATGARRNPLHFQITTAGDDPVSPCGDQHDYACKILDGLIEDESTHAFFAFIAHADLEDDWLDERTWRKANPHYGVSVEPAEVRKLALKAKNMPSAAAEFKQKILNLWVNSNAPWLSLEGWRAGQTGWSIEELLGRKCWAGVDLSSKIDLSVIVLAFPPDLEGEGWKYLLSAFTPADTLAQRAHRDRAPYQRWVDEGFLTTIPGNRIDQNVLLEELRRHAERFDLQEIGVDPWNAGNLITDLNDEGFQALEVPQNMSQMSGPSKEFEADVLAGLVDVGGNPLFAWSASNAVVQRDGKDNIYPVKKKSRGRIDPIVAAIIARKLAEAPGLSESAYADGHPLMQV